MYKATIVFDINHNFDWKNARKALAMAIVGNVKGVCGADDAFITTEDGMLPEELIPKQIEVARFPPGDGNVPMADTPLSKLIVAFREAGIFDWQIRYNIEDRDDKTQWTVVSVSEGEQKKAQAIMKGIV